MLAGSAENSARSSGSDESSDNEGSSHTVTKKRKYRVIKNGVYCLVLASQQAAIKQGWQRRNSQKEAPTKKPQDPSEIRRQDAKLGWEKRRHTELKCSLI